MAQKVSTCLLFASEAKEAAELYVSLISGSRITSVSHYGKAGPLPEGTVMVVEFELAARNFMALNAGQGTPYTNAHSMAVQCDTQGEIDRLWDGLIAAGGKELQCGWLNDRYGLAWQIMPSRMPGLLNDPDREKAARVMSAMMKMVKLDIEQLEAAYAGT